MAEKKKANKKEEKGTTNKKVAIPNVQSKAEVLVKEDVYPAIEIVEMLSISSFDFFRMKQEMNIEDGTFLTISEFQNLYKQIKGR